MNKRCQKREDNSFTLQEMPFAENNANGWVGQGKETKEPRRETETIKWAIRTLTKFND